MEEVASGEYDDGYCPIALRTFFHQQTSRVAIASRVAALGKPNVNGPRTANTNDFERGRCP